MTLALFLSILLALGLLVVVGTLMVGLVGMANGKDFNKKYGNKIMRLRVAAQLACVVIFVLLVLVMRA